MNSCTLLTSGQTDSWWVYGRWQKCLNHLRPNLWHSQHHDGWGDRQIREGWHLAGGFAHSPDENNNNNQIVTVREGLVKEVKVVNSRDSQLVIQITNTKCWLKGRVNLIFPKRFTQQTLKQCLQKLLDIPRNILILWRKSILQHEIGNVFPVGLIPNLN